MDFTPGSMEKLVELLRPPEPEVLQGDDLNSIGYEITSIRNKSEINQNIEKKTPNTIEEFEDEEIKEVEKLATTGFGAEDRKTPAYSMIYQQAVTAEDIFLQMGPKTPSSASCEHLIVKIKMPGDNRENIDLSIDRSSVTVISSQYYLKLPLPHGIDPDGSKANWDSTETALLLTLKLDREFDYVNL